MIRHPGRFARAHARAALERLTLSGACPSECVSHERSISSNGLRPPIILARAPHRACFIEATQYTKVRFSSPNCSLILSPLSHQRGARSHHLPNVVDPTITFAWGQTESIHSSNARLLRKYVAVLGIINRPHSGCRHYDAVVLPGGSLFQEMW
jgi:hypothetical protein